VGSRFSAPIQTSPGAHPASYTTGIGSFPGAKVAGAWRWPPTPSSAEVEGRVKLYICFPSGPSWPVIGWTLPLWCTWRKEMLFHLAKTTHPIMLIEWRRLVKSYNETGWTGMNVMCLCAYPWALENQQIASV